MSVAAQAPGRTFQSVPRSPALPAEDRARFDAELDDALDQARANP
jgi:hypothetical protein